MKKYYCIKCRRKLVVNSYSTWNHNLSEETIKLLYANFTAWTCSHCNLAFVFMNTSGNENTVLTIINLESYLQKMKFPDARKELTRLKQLDGGIVKK